MSTMRQPRQSRRLYVIAIKAKQSWQLWQKRRKSDFPLVLFSQELLALLDAGLSLVESLEALRERIAAGNKEDVDANYCQTV